MTRLTIAVLAPGAMGSAVGRRLAENGARVLVPLSGRSEASCNRAADAGMEAADDTAVARADVILSIIPPAEAVAAAERCAAAMQGAPAKPLFVDCNAIDTRTMTRVAAVVAAAGARCADGCIIGAPAKPGEVGPRLYVSGEAAEDLRSLGELGIDVRVMPGAIGAASALKMSYAGITKGLTALAAAMIGASVRAGADEALIGELRESQPELLKRFGKALPDMYPKAYRWAGEMREVEAFLGADRAEAGIYGAMANFYERLSNHDSGDEIAALDSFLAAAKQPP